MEQPGSSLHVNIGSCPYTSDRYCADRGQRKCVAATKCVKLPCIPVNNTEVGGVCVESYDVKNEQAPGASFHHQRQSCSWLHANVALHKLGNGMPRLQGCNRQAELAQGMAHTCVAGMRMGKGQGIQLQKAKGIQNHVPHAREVRHEECQQGEKVQGSNAAGPQAHKAELVRKA